MSILSELKDAGAKLVRSHRLEARDVLCAVEWLEKSRLTFFNRMNAPKCRSCGSINNIDFEVDNVIHRDDCAFVQMYGGYTDSDPPVKNFVTTTTPYEANAKLQAEIESLKRELRIERDLAEKLRNKMASVREQLK